MNKGSFSYPQKIIFVKGDTEAAYVSEAVQKSADSCFCGSSFCVCLRIAISLNDCSGDFTKEILFRK